MDIQTMPDEVGVRRLSVTGRITQNDLGEQWAALDRLMYPGDAPCPLLLDLGAADFVDSSGLSWLLMWHKRYNGLGTKLVLHSVPPMVFDVLRMMRLDSVFNIASDEKAARAMLQGAVG